MRRSEHAVIVALLASLCAGGSVAAQGTAQDTTQAADRFEVPEAGVAVAFPADWQVMTVMVRGEAELPPALVGLTEADRWTVLEAWAPEGSGCQVFMYVDHPLSLKEHADWTEQGAQQDGAVAVTQTTVALPVGDAARLDIDFREDVLGTAYMVESDVARYQLACIGEARPADDWLSVAETLELTEPVGLPAATASASGPFADELGADVDLVRDFLTEVAVVDPSSPGFPQGSLMKAECDFALYIEAEDGSATEWIACSLSDDPVEPADYQGRRPTNTITTSGGECVWRSDYWYERDRSQVEASAFEVIVTSTGNVFGRSTYPAEPLDCPIG